MSTTNAVKKRTNRANSHFGRSRSGRCCALILAFLALWPAANPASAQSERDRSRSFSEPRYILPGADSESGGYGSGTGTTQGGGTPRLNLDMGAATNPHADGINFVVFFSPYSAALDIAAQETMMIVAEVAREMPQAAILVLIDPKSGRDSTGLATLRAAAIRQELVRQRVSARRVSVSRDPTGTLFATLRRGALSEVGEWVEIIILPESPPVRRSIR